MIHVSKKGWLLLVLAVLAAGTYLYIRPLPPVEPISQVLAVPKTAPVSLPWPAAGQAALGAVGYGVLEKHNTAAPVPIASVAKVITALAVLQQKPLAPGSQGPAITLDSTDVDYFNHYYANDGSVVNVSNGEQISEYQMLQAMLIPSANNIADSLARWAFGSTANYVSYANKMVSGMGAAHTTVGNTNGFDDTTLSTADDLVLIGIKALGNPVIADVVSQPTATIPPGVQIKNVNWLLGSNGVVGIKTGNTDKAGGCYLFSAKRQAAGQQITVVGAVIGAPDLSAAISAAPPLLSASDSGFEPVKVVAKSQVIATYKSPWGTSTQLKSSKDLSLLVWKGKDIKILNSLESLNAPAASGSALGSISAEGSGQSASSPLYFTQSLPGPSWHWRIFRK
jgi:serine-type D-Ala-D-Ala carboxypeptidase (penicillin-binding protein 5/6)